MGTGGSFSQMKISAAECEAGSASIRKRGFTFFRKALIVNDLPPPKFFDSRIPGNFLLTQSAKMAYYALS